MVGFSRIIMRKSKLIKASFTFHRNRHLFDMLLPETNYNGYDDGNNFNDGQGGFGANDHYGHIGNDSLALDLYLQNIFFSIQS